MSKLQSVAEEYFSQINPIASRIYADFQDTRNAYDCVWDTLSCDEQMQVLNESIIKPEVTLQYSLKTKSCENEQKSIVYAQKTIVDENIAYRDEHSAPFSYKTASQIDLRLFESTKKQNAQPKIKLPQIKKTENKPAEIEPQSRYKMESSIFDKILGRKNNPDSEQEVLVSPDDVELNTNSTLPKTGLDFLDNW